MEKNKIYALRKKWFPIASSSDLVKRHVFQAQLLGREFAVWRADDGNVNVWENRCLHRGVRLSIGINQGSELKCQYHGWRYANRTAGCTYIPAHPADAPARTICNNTYPVKEFIGMIWSGEDAIENDFSYKELSKRTVLRPVPINAPNDLVQKNLLNCYSELNFDGLLLNDGSIEINLGGKKKILFFIQPQDSKLSVVRGVLNATLSDEKRYHFLKEQNFIIERFREKMEQISENLNLEPMVAEIEEISNGLGEPPSKEECGRKAELRLHVSERILTSRDVVSLKLKGIEGQLPTFQPGAHIDLHLQNGLIRQYSLVNGPGETDHYRIGVKLEKDGRGGSQYIHNNIKVGDLLATSAPRNNFPLRRDSLYTIFIAGGIGITPLLSMSKALHSMELDYEFHYFVQSEKDISFKETLKILGERVIIHKGLSQENTINKVRKILQKPSYYKNLYVCGPGPMLEATLKIASDLKWADDTIHFEYFKNDRKINNDSNFEIELARSALTLTVSAGKTILEILRENGVDLPSSCEQGACGTCKVNVIRGDIDHQDVYLNATERANKNIMMTCVSRSLSDRLILDI